jgi:DNA-binding NarL/FixJ family response regulator
VAPATGETQRQTAAGSPPASAAAAAPSAAPADPVQPNVRPTNRASPHQLYRILIVDDHPVVRRGVRSILDGQPGLHVCAEASDGDTALDLVKKDKPDLIVLDLTLPNKNGLDVTVTVREQFPETEVLVLTMHFSDELAREVLRCGALGYMLKSDADAELLAAVDHMRHHQPFFTARLAATMAQNFVEGIPADDPNGKSDTALTERETQVVTLLAEGKSNKEVAGTLGVSTRTVESHRNHIMRKMNFTSFSELIRYAVRANLVAP